MSHRTPPAASPRLRRCLLATPASSMKMITKSLTSDADAVFLDLEDAVSASEKASARQTAITAINELDWAGHGKTISLRINGLDTDWALDDLVEVLPETAGKLDTVILPKCGSAEDIYAIDVIATQLARRTATPPIGIEGLIETAQGAANIQKIAEYNRSVSGPRLEALHFGAGDYAASVSARTVEIGGLNPDYPGDQWHGILSQIVAQCRANGLVPMDSAHGNFNDDESYIAAAKRALAIGFNGKWAIHPNQIPLANGVFSPSDDDVKRAQGILDAMEAAAKDGKGAASYEGKMIDMASERMARSILAVHHAITAS